MAFDPARVKSLFLGASDLPSPEERAAYLGRECGGEPDLRARVEALLAVEERAGPVLEPTGVFDPSRAEPVEVTEMSASETLQGSRVSDPDAGLATVGATGVDGEPSTLAGVPSAVRPGRFVPGQVIGGRYTLLEVLGEGGMGTVYRAEQSQPVKRMVALKLIKVGLDSRSVLARFDAERQALAMMDHPNIARVYDGGATDAGQPFFVMEFVHGVPITDYCDQHRLSVDARLELFVAACQAVQHAHQKGIIHRDIKPSNVMVTEVDGRATPKVIDFGVAKATEATLTDQSLGDTGVIVGTPTYMSPEQADPSTQDIDTRTDVYALGVILYELLAGSTPLDASQFKRGALLEMLRMVREVDPSKPSTKVSTADALPSIAANRGIDPEHLKRELRGDLDWIVMKALEKDRTRRYETANGFGADILRHLASEPVLAAPPSRSYRLRKFVRKHRAGVIAASLVLLALVAGVAGATWGLFEARRAADAERLARLDAQENEKKAVAAAEGERLAKIDAQNRKRLAEENEKKALAAADAEKKAKETVEGVLGFVEKRVFAAARPKGLAGGLGYDVKLADAMTAALPSIKKDFPDKPLVEARLRETIGISFLSLGKPQIAVGQFELARSLHGRHLGPDHPETLGSMANLATSYADLGRHAEALKLREQTLALRKTKLGPDHPLTLTSMANLATSYDALRRHAEALKLRDETLALRKAKLGPDHPDTLQSMDNLADSYDALRRHAEALKLREETLALRKAKLGPDHPDTLQSMDNLADSYDALRRHAEALKLREETLALRKAKLGPDHPETLVSMNNLASSYLATGRVREALSLLEEGSHDKKGGAASSRTLGSLQVWLGQDKEYGETRRRVLALVKGTDDAAEARRAAQTAALRPSTDPEELEAVLALGRKAIELNRREWELLALGMAEFRNGHFVAADDALLAAMKAGKNSNAAGIADFYRAMSLFQQGKKDEARDLATRAAAKMKPLPKDEQNPLADGGDPRQPDPLADLQGGEGPDRFRPAPRAYAARREMIA